MNVTLTLPPETERRLQAKAAREGRTLESYLRHLVEADLREYPGTVPATTPRPDQPKQAPADDLPPESYNSVPLEIVTSLDARGTPAGDIPPRPYAPR